MNNNKISDSRQRSMLGVNNRELLKVMGSPWFTWGMTLISAFIALSDYFRHLLSWFDGLLLGVWCIAALVELIAIRVYRRRAK